MKLSKAQGAMLARLAASGWELAPGGSRAAGRTASGWWRTSACLVAQGLAERLPDAGGTVRITAAGREVLARQG